MADLPACGLYRTGRALGEVAIGRLVYFHNHGNPGAGIYVPTGWHQNRARFAENGMPIPDAEWAQSLVALPAEGFYRVESLFDCCDKKCRSFEPTLMVQLGYDASAEAILFVPEWTANGFVLPDRGSRISSDRLRKLTALKVSGTAAGVDRVVH